MAYMKRCSQIRGRFKYKELCLDNPTSCYPPKAE